MADVTCSRCGQTAPSLARAPMPGPTGARILAQVCAGCWDEWLRMQVKFINEYRLNPLDEKHFEFLQGQAREFLKLKDEAAS
jgi:Fe-S cluster biosynthesis and repair protein YggX